MEQAFATEIEVERYLTTGEHDLIFHAHDLKLVPSVTVYMRWGKGPRRRLRFTKTGDAKLEEAYSRHFLWPGKDPFHPPAPRSPADGSFDDRHT